MSAIIQKEWMDKWNPFNSMKLLAHVERWSNIYPNGIPPVPALVTIDPSNNCNLNCSWCNSQKSIVKPPKYMGKKVMKILPQTLKEWECDDYFRVHAVCIAGGGEPLMNPDIGDLIESLVSNRIEVGIITNGTMMGLHLEALSKCTWVGVSVDAGTPQTYHYIKGKDQFKEVIENIRLLKAYSEEHKTNLAKFYSGYGITYKYLLHPDNVGDVEAAAKVAKEIGLTKMHIRPYGKPWDQIETPSLLYEDIPFGKGHLDHFYLQLERARNQYEDENFHIYGITHKFDGSFAVNNQFDKCWAVFMTGVFSPGSTEDNVKFGLCCDRRGDDRVVLIEDCFVPDLIVELEVLWGSESHWKIADQINKNLLKMCPRCTYQPHNQIYEKVILQDLMTWKFI